jgi:DNA-binding beta-propeller fold protein YncE
VFGAGIAAVVADSHLATVDLGAPIPKPDLIELDEDLEPPRTEEVLLSGDASWAFVRRFGTNEVLLVDLLARTVDSIAVGLDPTDLDLSPDGAHAVVVARGSHEIWRFDMQDPYANPDVLALPTSDPLGSLSFAPGGALGVLYTTSGSDRYAVWDLATDKVQVRRLVKPVRSVGITPTGDAMMVLHTKTDAPDADPKSPFFGSWALTMVSLEDFRTNPLKLPAEPIGFANSNNGRSGYFVMKGEPRLAVIDYATLRPTEIRLKSEPVFIGVLPDLNPNDDDEPAAWVSQEHHLGRISFFDPDAGSLETITGFELNSQIED